MTEDHANQTGRKPLAPETKVFSRLDGEPGTILNRFGPGEYEVMTDDGIERWREEDIQTVDESQTAGKM